MLDEIGNIGEFVGALAVVVSLVYLSVQLRQSTRTVRAATHQSIVSAAAACNATLTTNKELARVFRIGSSDPAELDDDERVQFSFLCAQLIDIFENLYLQRRYETLDDDFWLPRSRAYLAMMELSGVLQCWEERKDSYTPAFTEWVDAERSRDTQGRFQQRFFLARDSS